MTAGQSEDPLAREGELLPDGIRVGRLLAVGGMASVYEGELPDGRAIAVKIMHKELLGTPTVRERFLREGRVTAALAHPGIPKVHAMHELPDGTVAIALELLSGETVADRMERRGGYLAPQEVLAISDRVLAILEVAHAADVVHRDIKPENVFLTADGELKLLDFGIARARQASGSALTLAGQALGTPAFMSPEQANGRWHEVDARTDLWAVGATMWSALAGEPPHARATTAEELAAASSLDARPISEVVGGLKKPLSELIDRALARKREARFPDAASMRAAVRAAWEAHAGETSMEIVWRNIASEVEVREGPAREPAAPTLEVGADAPPPPAPAAPRAPLPSPPTPPAPPPAAPRRGPDRRRIAWAIAALVALAVAVALALDAR